MTPEQFAKVRPGNILRRYDGDLYLVHEVHDGPNYRYCDIARLGTIWDTNCHNWNPVVPEVKPVPMPTPEQLENLPLEATEP